MRELKSERGFTVIELMIVVAIIAIIAAVAIPSFTREARRGKAKTEVQPMFAELSTREDQYRTENGAYLTAAACPATAVSGGTDSFQYCLTAGSAWTNLRVNPSTKMLECSYTVTTGTSATNPVPLLPSWVTGVTASSLASSWYFIEATCPNNYAYFTASWDSKFRSKDNK